MFDCKRVIGASGELQEATGGREGQTLVIRSM